MLGHRPDSPLAAELSRGNRGVPFVTAATTVRDPDVPIDRSVPGDLVHRQRTSRGGNSVFFFHGDFFFLFSLFGFSLLLRVVSSYFRGEAFPGPKIRCESSRKFARGSFKGVPLASPSPLNEVSFSIGGYFEQKEERAKGDTDCRQVRWFSCENSVAVCLKVRARVFSLEISCFWKIFLARQAGEGGTRS